MFAETALIEVLLDPNLPQIKGISPGTFDEFVTGFNQAHELFSIVDVGMGKEASDAKVRGELPRSRLCVCASRCSQCG